MKKFNFKINGNEYQTTVEQNGELLQVTVNGKSYAAELLQDEAAPKPVATAPKAAAAAAPAAAAAAPKAPTGAGKVVESPLPGVVVSIAVTEGQAVKAGDLLLTLEAMKMENAIQADNAGTVTKILVSNGQSVQSGDPLVEIA
jgi:biotin carboxyl carrier protein